MLLCFTHVVPASYGIHYNDMHIDPHSVDIHILNNKSAPNFDGITEPQEGTTTFSNIKLFSYFKNNYFYSYS